MRADSQRAKILKYLKTHKRGITSMEAFTKFNCTRLSGVIYALKKAGNDIETIMVDGEHSRYARYILR